MDTALWESSNWAHPARYRHTRIIGVTEKIAEYRQQEKPETQILTSVVEEMLDDARKWWAAGDWYARKGVDWRRGYLLYGPPGNGKTTAAVALARELRLPVYVPDLSTYTNEEFASWIDGFSNCIFLIEDIHLCYDGTQSLMGEGSLTFDCLLNCLGGAIPLSGVLVLITTNDPSKMDPALSGIHDGRTSRPGRVDRSFKFDNPTAAEREALIQSFQLSAADTQVLLERTKGDLSVAQVREQCIQLAIQRHWDMTLTNAKASLNNVRDIRTTTP
jgi:chaperone BCS1